ncbi:MAG: hypothetical protein ACMUHM_02790 [Thermoplasmatota archaeon]
MRWGKEMSTDYTFTHTVKSDAPMLVMMEAVQDALSPLGGTVTTNDEKGMINIENGKIGIFGDFMFETSARLIIKKKEEGKYSIKCRVSKDPNYIFWLLLIAGFCTGFWVIWGLNIYYLIIDMGKEYQKRLENLEAHL